MQTIQVNIYKFSELSETAQQYAIEQRRELKYQDSSVPQWAIDDCYLFEPPHLELNSLFGEEWMKQMDKPIISNNRKIYFSVDRDRHLDADEGIVINNEEMFLLWLGIPKEMHEKVYFTIKDDGIRYPDTKIEFEPNDYEYEFTDEEEKILDNAIDKFSNHMHNVLSRIEDAMNWQYTDEYIIEEFEINDYNFTEDGKIYY